MTEAIFQAPEDPGRLRLVPIGGLGEFGMNTLAIMHQQRLFVVDCGIRFPDPSKLGVDAAVPDVSPWFRQAGGVFAYLITHGHEDHIGALPHLVREWPAPIYATAWTAALIEAKFTKFGLDAAHHPITVVRAGDRVDFKDFSAEFIHVTHSIPHCCALYIKTSAGSLVHTGDFKIDLTPVLDRPTDLDRFRSIGASGLDALLSDSTNADRSGPSPGEGVVLPALVRSMAATKGAVIVSTFSSNLWRLKTIADACIATGRRLFVAGAGMGTTLEIGKNLQIYSLPEGLRIGEEELIGIAREKLVIAASGCQGEWRSALARMAQGEFRAYAVEPGDHVILSSRVIPGNERAIIAMIDNLQMRGASVATGREDRDLHVSGHAYRDDISQLIAALKPRWHLPVHGTHQHLTASATIDVPQTTQAAPKRLVLRSGDVLDLCAGNFELVSRIELEQKWVDAESLIALPHTTLRERWRIGELGLVIVTGVYSHERQTWVVPCGLETHGIHLVQGGDATREAQASALTEKVSRIVESGCYPGMDGQAIEDVLEDARIGTRRSLMGLLRKKPVVAMKIHIVS